MENLSQEQITKIKDMLSSMDLDSFNQSLIKDNKIIFIIDDYVYRCKMPTQKDLALAEDLENRLKVEYLQKDNYITRKKLIQVLKEKHDVDINDLEKQKEKLQDDLKDVYLDLAIVQTSEEEELERLKEKKNLIEMKFTSIIIEITEFLKPSIEEQCRRKYYEFLTANCTEKSDENDEWIKVWDKIENYQEDSSKLANNAIGYLQTLMLNVRD